MTVHDTGKLPATDARVFCRCRDIQFQWFQAIMPHRKPRMRWILHRQCPFLPMAVNWIRVAGVTIFKAKNHTPISRHRNGPGACRAAFEGVWPAASEFRGVVSPRFQPAGQVPRACSTADVME